MRNPPSDSELTKARSLVFAFADIMAANQCMIYDAASLPCSRAHLRAAFTTYINWMYQERDRNPSAFERNGYGDTLRAAESCFVHIDDFHDIAPEDKAGVKKLNSLGLEDDMDMDLAKLMLKYPAGGARN